MAIYSFAARTTGVTSGTAGWEIRTTATNRSKLLELGIFMAAATASTFGLGRPAAIGVTPTSPQTFLAEDSGAPAGGTTSALAWGTGPTIPAGFLRRIALPATIGTGVIWTFPQGILIPVSGSLVLWNLALNGVTDVYAVIDE